jgi:prepilin-type N-terminal cleavage/methylation domain-containing protein
MKITHRRDERGMTLVEMMLALFVFSIVMAGALSFLRAQGRAFSLGSERVMMYQNIRYVVNEMEKDLRTAGAATADQQPQLIYVASNVVAFNANYWTNTPGDPTAVYYNPDAPDSAVQAMTKAQKTTIPMTSFGYPDTSYMVSGANSAAETIIFYFVQDSTSSRTDDYILYRKVNTGTPEVVARNVLQTSGVPFLQYYRQITPFGGGTPTLQLVAAASLPLMHTAKIHLSPSDTGVYALIDSIRAVRVNYTTTNGRTGSYERLRQVSRMIRLPNAGLANRKSCGDPPLPMSAPVATRIVVNSVPVVQLAWSPATDENAGEKDVERYVVWRRPSTTTDWGDPLVSIPSGSPSYVYVDGSVTTGTTYYYAVAAQDCSPALSAQALSGSVTP